MDINLTDLFANSTIASNHSDRETIDSLRVFDSSYNHPEDWPRLYRAHGSVEGESLPYSRIWFATYAIVGYTPQGVWIDQGTRKPKFVNLKAMKQWACLTKQRALEQFRRRKVAQLRHLASATYCAESNLAHAEQLLNPAKDIT